MKQLDLDFEDWDDRFPELDERDIAFWDEDEEEDDDVTVDFNEFTFH